MAIFLGSWRVVHPYRSVPGGHTSIEEFVHVAHSADVGSALRTVAQNVRERLRTDREFRKLLGIEKVLEPELFNIVFQPPLTKIDV